MKKRVWAALDGAEGRGTIGRILVYVILALIVLNALAVIVGSVQSVGQRYARQLALFELVSVVIFSLEYLARLWSCTADDRYRGPFRGRLRFVLTPMALVDLIAVLPFFLPFVGVDLRFVRSLRLVRIVRLAKVGRYVTALHLLGRVLRSKKEELVLTTAVMGLLLVITSTLVYYAEHAVQPEAFPDIPSAMWWAVVTLTTVGYGDVYPITALGKLLAAVTAIMGIGLFALPTGVLGAGFVEEIQKRKGQTRCPHCGREPG